MYELTVHFAALSLVKDANESQSAVVVSGLLLRPPNPRNVGLAALLQ